MGDVNRVPDQTKYRMMWKVITFLLSLPLLGVLAYVIAFFIAPWDIYPEYHVHSVSTTTPFTIALGNNVSSSNITGGFNITLGVYNKPFTGFIARGGANASLYYNHSGNSKGAEGVDSYYMSSTFFKSLCPGRMCTDKDVKNLVPIIVNVNSSIDDYLIASAMDRELQRGILSLSMNVTIDWQPMDYHEYPVTLVVVCQDIKVGVPTGVMLTHRFPCDSYV